MAEPEAGEIAETLARLGSPVENRNKGGKVLKRANHPFYDVKNQAEYQKRKMQFKEERMPKRKQQWEANVSKTSLPFTSLPRPTEQFKFLWTARPHIFHLIRANQILSFFIFCLSIFSALRFEG